MTNKSKIPTSTIEHKNPSNNANFKSYGSLFHDFRHLYEGEVYTIERGQWRANEGLGETKISLKL